MSEEAAEQHCTYQLLDEGVHEFVFVTSGKAAIEEFFAYLENILASTPHNETLRYVVDVSRGDKPVSMVALAQRFRKLDGDIPKRARGRTAILHKPGILISFFDNFIRAMAPGRDITRFFPVEKRDEALEWLTTVD